MLLQKQSRGCSWTPLKSKVGAWQQGDTAHSSSCASTSCKTDTLLIHQPYFSSATLSEQHQNTSTASQVAVLSVPQQQCSCYLCPTRTPPQINCYPCLTWFGSGFLLWFLSCWVIMHLDPKPRVHKSCN
jgi:hypothetical protein